MQFREDSSNSSNKYTRNYFRNELLPAVEKVFPQVRENLLHNLQRFEDINSLYRLAVDELKGKLVNLQGKEIHIPVLKLLKTPALHTIIYEIVKEHGFTVSQVPEVIKLLNSESGKYILSGSSRILRNRKWLIISPLNDAAVTHVMIEEKDDDVKFSAYRLTIDRGADKTKIPADSTVAMLDARMIKLSAIASQMETGRLFLPTRYEA